MKILVLGAGIVGASCAYHLAQLGAAVTLLDGRGVGGDASSKSFGWINASFAESDAYFELRQAAVSYTRELSNRLDLANEIQWNGCLWWEDSGKAFADQQQTLAARDYSAKTISARDFQTLEPNFKSPPQASIHTPFEGAADGEKLARKLTQLAVRAGASVWNGTKVTGLCWAGDRCVGVQTDRGLIEGDHVVMAVGAETENLLTGSGITLPMRNQPGTIIHTTPTEKLINHIIMTPDVHFRQATDGTFTLGEIFSGTGGVDRDPSVFAQDILARMTAKVRGAEHLRVQSIQLGLRPEPIDGMPAVGSMRAGLSIAVMHSGITLAPLVGKLIAQNVIHGDKDPLMAPFDPKRFSS